ncbi:MAG TPA: GNAT family N-acetyltransferase [Chitinophagaceae bacterium]|nr:GNAT family N-acetyltransferase [Chitinophagaceae bacterium]
MENINNLPFKPSLVSQETELVQILDLQKKNLAMYISEDEIRNEGFVTLSHDLETLQKMHRLAPSVVIKDGDTVIAYALAMLKECRQLIPDLDPMFSLFDTLHYNNKPLNDYRFYVMGQICIDKAYRGLGLVEKLYTFHKQQYAPLFDLMVTEIATRNKRSMRAHKKNGFQSIHIYRDQLDEWAVVAWDWS